MAELAENSTNLPHAAAVWPPQLRQRQRPAGFGANPPGGRMAKPVVDCRKGGRDSNRSQEASMSEQRQTRNPAAGMAGVVERNIQALIARRVDEERQLGW